MLLDDLTPLQRLQLLNELLEAPTPDEITVIRSYQQAQDEAEIARAANDMAADIASRRNNPTGNFNNGIEGKKLF